jgi:hypothetical protein
VEGSCEHGNEPSGSIKCWEVLEQQSECLGKSCYQSVQNLFPSRLLPSSKKLQYTKL